MVFKESETIEFKKSTAELKSGVVSVVAILNKHGKGTLYFGIKDDGTVVGQDVGHHTIKEVTQTIVDNIEPKIYPEIVEKKIKGKDCLVIDFIGSDGPYFAYGRAYMRVGESDKQLSAKQTEELIRRKKFSWDKEISEKGIKDVNVEAVKEFMKKAKTAKRIDFDFVDVKTTLHKLDLLKGKHLTNAAEVLFCDHNPLEVQAAIFAGIDKLTFLDIKSFKGNLFSLRQQSEVYLNGNIRWRADLSESRRKEIPEIPVRAISEAIGNSLCHRDFYNPKGNEVAIFKDRVEVYNPGLFPEGVNPEDFFSGHEHSILRNPLIAETMYKSKDIERWGSGIKRIHDECISAGVKVEFKRLKTGFVVVFYRPKWEEGEGLGEDGKSKTGEETRVKTRVKTREKILGLLRQDPDMSTADLAEILGLTVKGVEWQLKQLKDENLIKRVGSKRAGHWEILGE